MNCLVEQIFEHRCFARPWPTQDDHASIGAFTERLLSVARAERILTKLTEMGYLTF